MLIPSITTGEEVLCDIDEAAWFPLLLIEIYHF
jgi:hypothetical protein